MKVTLITVVFNAKATIASCIASVLAQDYPDVEYLVIDGQSTDGTLAILERFRPQLSLLVSEADKGMYDALNKGIALATGDVIGILNADDELADAGVVSAVVNAFHSTGADGVYGNLDYVDAADTSKVIRKWRTKQVSGTAMRFGWMPAHPTLYLKKETFDHFGHYSLVHGSAADYELMLRFIYRHNIDIRFLNKLMVNMRVGGMSNQSWKHRWSALVNDFKALKNNQVPFPVFVVLFKKLSKVFQFLK